MQTLTEIVAAVVVHSSAAAYSHFGVTLEAHQVEKPAAAERTIARSNTPKPPAKTSSKLAVKPSKASTMVRDDNCPEQKARVVRT